MDPDEPLCAGRRKLNLVEYACSISADGSLLTRLRHHYRRIYCSGLPGTHGSPTGFQISSADRDRKHGCGLPGGANLA